MFWNVILKIALSTPDQKPLTFIHLYQKSRKKLFWGSAILCQVSAPSPWWQVAGFVVMREMPIVDDQILQSNNWETNVI